MFCTVEFEFWEVRIDFKFSDTSVMSESPNRTLFESFTVGIVESVKESSATVEFLLDPSCGRGSTKGSAENFNKLEICRNFVSRKCFIWRCLPSLLSWRFAA